MKPKIIAILVVAILVLIVLFQNTNVVKVRLLFWSFEMSQVILILLLLIVGFVLGFMTAKLVGRRGNR